ncbi:MAG: spore maturation protein [Pseudomonadales bacterium]|nr:spore maturation protein [Pseudomonadales bacterium]
MLNRLWLSFFILSFIACLYQTFYLGQSAIFSEVTSALFSMAKTSVDISISLVGIMCLWLGVFNVIEQSGLIKHISRLLSPLLHKLMPEVPANHPAHGAITMNLAANLLGLDNAATPLGIKAMQSLQSLNPSATTASNAQILFLVLNTSSVTLLPVTIFMYRAQAGSASATDVFLPILIATSCSTLAGLLAVSLVQRINLFQPVIASYMLGFAILMAGLFSVISTMDSTQLSAFSSLTANMILFSFIVLSLCYGAWKKLEVYDVFIEGAKQGFETAINLIPYLIAMLTAIAALRASGVMALFIEGLVSLLSAAGLPTSFADALPTALMKPFSGSGSRALMLENFQSHGVDSFIGRLSSVMQGSTETTFYVLAVYFGAVGIRYGRHAIACGLIADMAGIIAAIVACYWFFPV